MSPLTGRRQLIALGAFCVLAVVVRVTWSGMYEYRQGQDLEQQEEWHEAAVHHGQAIHMYLPFSPIPGKAAKRLLALAAAAEARGEPREARFCYEELRSGFLSVRSFYQPGKRYVEQAEAALVPLMAADVRGGWPDPGLPAQEREAAIREVLAEREDPSTLWVLVMGLGYAVWLGAAAMAIGQGLPADDHSRVRWPRIIRWAAISLAGYGTWLLGVALA